MAYLKQIEYLQRKLKQMILGATWELTRSREYYLARRSLSGTNLAQTSNGIAILVRVVRWTLTLSPPKAPDRAGAFFYLGQNYDDVVGRERIQDFAGT